MIARLLLVAGFGLLLAGCATRTVQFTPKDSQLVGRAPGDTVETLPGVILDRAVTIISVVRTFDDGGFLGVCGALVLASPKDIQDELGTYAQDVNSDLVIGPDSQKPIKILPRFMRRYPRESVNGNLDPKSVDYASLQGDCIVTQAPWRPEYRSSNRLDLRKTTYRSGGPTYIYVPRGRR
jgi:hypothetical protein